MSATMVQIRNVAPEFHRRLKARAAMEGMSMSEYVLREVGKALDRPTRQEVLDRLRARPDQRLARSAAAVIRADRDAHWPATDRSPGRRSWPAPWSSFKPSA